MSSIVLTYLLYTFLFLFFQADSYAFQKQHVQFNPASKIIIFDTNEEPLKLKEDLSYQQFSFPGEGMGEEISVNNSSQLFSDIDRWYEGVKNGNLTDLSELLKRAATLKTYPYTGKRCLAHLLDLKRHCQEHPDHILNKTEEFRFFLNTYEEKAHHKFLQKLNKHEAILKEELEVEELFEDILRGNENALQHLIQIYATENSDIKRNCAQFFLEKLKSIYKEKKDTDNNIYLMICLFL